ncbi:MAG TPA: efflux transporter outer membrane subunit [Rhizomicrobium sp.]|nr:efflux transporter outer membrane subunit [Rhizomicrobium sp.]
MTKLMAQASVLVLALVAAGCTTDEPLALKQTDIPSKFDGPIPEKVGVWPAKEWWHGFNSPELDGLIATAETDNLNIAVAFAAVLQAQAQTNIERSSLFPSITLNPSAERSASPSSLVTASTGSRVALPGKTVNTFSFTANGTWSPDIWGLARDNLNAAEDTLRAQRYAQEEVTLTEVSDVGTTYLDILALRERVTLAKKNVEDAKRVLAITQAKLANGVSSQLDLAQEQALVAQQEANIPVLEEQMLEARNALAILLGRPPEGFDVKGQNLNGIATPLVAPGMPSQLLLRRPDIAQAEAQLASAHANVDAARAAFFPAVTITGQAGTTSGLVGTLFHASTFEWSAGASALQTLFDAGRLFGESDLAKAQQLSLVASYRQTVISAFSNVENSLNQVSNFAIQQAALEREVKASAEAERISELQYREGIVDLTTLIQTQQTLFTAQDVLAQARLAHAQAVINLYESLGGGWSQNPEDNTQPLPGTVEAADREPAPVPDPEDSIWRKIGSIFP